MSEKIWLGRIFLVDEGGFDIVMRSLRYYRKRLKNISSSPELRDAPMFITTVQSAVESTGPQLDELIKLLPSCLIDSSVLKDLDSQIPLIEKALTCYHSDIQKSLAGNSYYSKLIGNSSFAKNDLTLLPTAITKINQFM